MVLFGLASLQPCFGGIYSARLQPRLETKSRATKGARLRLKTYVRRNCRFQALHRLREKKQKLLLTLKLTLGPIMVVTMKLRIGEVARYAGVSVPTVRYYEASGLITSQGRADNGYRLFSRESISRMKFILHAKEAGFTIKEIRDLISLLEQEYSAATCRQVNEMISHKRKQITERIRSLRSIDQSLQGLQEHCFNTGAQEKCPALSILSESADVATKE